MTTEDRAEFGPPTLETFISQRADELLERFGLERFGKEPYVNPLSFTTGQIIMDKGTEPVLTIDLETQKVVTLSLLRTQAGSRALVLATPNYTIPKADWKREIEYAFDLDQEFGALETIALFNQRRQKRVLPYLDWIEGVLIKWSKNL